MNSSSNLPNLIKNALKDLDNMIHSGVNVHKLKGKKLKRTRRYYRFPLPAHYRAIYRRYESVYKFVWAGSHEDYNNLWRRLR